MTNAIDAVSVVATSPVNTSFAQNGLEKATLIRQRIENLSTEREAWETSAYVRSNELLYALIQKCYALYVDLTIKHDDVGAKKLGLRDFISHKGLSFKDGTPLTAKLIRCVFGDKDRRRLSTYHTVLRVAVANKWSVVDVPAKIAEFGGVQEISLGKPVGALTSKQKAEQARQFVLSQSLAKLASEKLAAKNDPEQMGEQAVALVTQESDGSFTVHCVVHSSAAVNAALASYFASNKNELAKQQAESTVTKSVLSQTDSIEVAANAAVVEQAA